MCTHRRNTENYAGDIVRKNEQETCLEQSDGMITASGLHYEAPRSPMIEQIMPSSIPSPQDDILKCIVENNLRNEVLCTCMG